MLPLTVERPGTPLARTDPGMGNCRTGLFNSNLNLNGRGISIYTKDNILLPISNKAVY